MDTFAKQDAMERIKELDADLKSMTELFFGEPPKLDSVIETLREWEARFNGGSQ